MTEARHGSPSRPDRSPAEHRPGVAPADRRSCARRAERAQASAAYPDALWITPDALLLALCLGGGGAPAALVRRRDPRLQPIRLAAAGRGRPRPPEGQGAA